VGSVLSIIGVSALVYGLIEAPDKGWTSTVTLAAFGISVFVLTVFAFWELRNPEPMLDIRYFRNPAFRIGTSGMILVFMAMYGVMFLITQYFQLVLGYSPLSASIRFVPIAVIMLIVAPRTPRAAERFGANRVVGFGMTCVATGFFMFLFLNTSTSYLYVFACLVVLVTGMALSIAPMTSSIMSAVPERRAGAGSAMNDATRELGAALGVAVLGSIAASAYRSRLGSAVSVLSPANRTIARSSIAGAIQSAGTLPKHAGAVLHHAASSAFVDGVHLAVGIGGTLALLAAILVVRNLPKEVVHEGAMHDAVSSLEDAAMFGIAGVPPIFAD
jgi:Na+/melibiose symporter-like transporter